MTALSQKEAQTGILTVAEQGCFRDASGMLQGLFLHANMEVYTSSLSKYATINPYYTFQLSEMSKIRLHRLHAVSIRRSAGKDAHPQH